MMFPIIFGFFALVGAEETETRRFEFREPHMGTTVRIVLYSTDKSQAETAARAAFSRVVELNRIMSDYDPDSELSRLCAAHRESLGPPTRVSPELFYVLKTGQEVARRSNGAFDLTIGPLVRLWRISRRTQRLPQEAALADARSRVGFDKLVLDESTRTVQFRVPGMQLDLGGIGKGYTADEILRILRQAGISRALAAVGGDIAVGDAPPGQPGWRIEIASLSGGPSQYTLRLAHAAVSTTGDKEQFVEINGVRYSHVVDPRTGLGQTGRRSVTVIAPQGILADSLTKAVALMEMDQAMRLIDQTPKAAALIIRRTEKGDEVDRSRRFDSYLEASQHPRRD